MKNLKIKLINIAKKNVLLRKLFRQTLYYYRYLRYKIRSFGEKVNPNLIVFCSFNGKNYSDSPKAIYEYLLKQEEYKDYQFVWFFKDINKYKYLEKNKNTKIIKQGSKEQEQYMIKAKYWIFNYRALDHQYPKKNQYFIQCWHGTPLKKMGYDLEYSDNAMNSIKEIRKKYKMDAKKIKYFLSPNSYVTEKFCSAWKIKRGKIIQCGYPRNDFLVNYTKEDIINIKKKLGLLNTKKKIILYAPSWRDNTYDAGVGYKYNEIIDFNVLKKYLNDDYIILFHAHYLASNQFNFEKYKNFVYDVSDYNDINELYVISDLLITDYSSIFFDYAILKRPIILYMHDLEEHKDQFKSFYLSLEELPFPIVKKERDLIREIKKTNQFRCSNNYLAFNEEYNSLNNGQATDRVIQKIYEKSIRKVPLIVNIFKRLQQDENNIKISGFGLTKVVREKNIDISKMKVIVNEQEYVISFAFKKGFPFVKKYRFNFYTIKFPLEDLLEGDIQNKIILDYDGNSGRILYNAFDLKRGKYRNSKIIKRNNMSIYLRQTNKNTMYLTVRESNYFDFQEGKRKLFFGYYLSKLILKKDIILLFEKEASRYEESASVLYEKLIDMGYNNVFYIIDQENPKLRQIKEKYQRKIIYKNSMKHICYFFHCEKFIGTESIAHALQLRVANKHVHKKYNSRDLMYVFLQHGVMYMISLDSDLRTGFQKQKYKLHRIVVSSKKEADHFIDFAGFDLSDLYICGLPKFDTAIRKNDADKILIMPTWRRWEVNLAAQDYTKTKYFQMMLRIIESIPDHMQSKVIMLPHPLMLDAIKNNSSFEKYLPKGEFSYDELLKDCALLITDYSSISYDAFFRGSNVIFYWEEKEECLENYGENAKLMLNEENAFGDVCYNKEDLEKIVEKNYKEEQNKLYQNRYQQIVSFHDRKNTERLIKMLKDDRVIK